jgi:hypothetical protein
LFICNDFYFYSLDNNKKSSPHRRAKDNNMNSTYFALMSEFGSGTVPLTEVCEKYFGLNEAQAQRRARNHQLPLSTFRGAKSQKSPILVNISDLAKHLDHMRSVAEKEFIAVNH